MLRENRSPGAATPGANAYDDNTLPSTTRVTREYRKRTPNQHARLLAGSAISRVGMSVGPHRSGVIDQMRALIADLDWWHREIGSAFREGYRAGYQAGYEVGYGRAHEEIAEAWREVAEHVRAHAYRITIPEQAALDRAYADGVPCSTPHQTGCSRCIRAAAVARRGGDYQGGPVEWDPQREPADRPHLRLVGGTA